MPRTGMTPEELKEKVIELAIHRIRQNGFEKMRLVDVAHDLDVSHVALYKHFKDKAALLDAISERWLLKLDAELEDVCASDREPLQKIQDWFLKLHQLKREKVLNDPELFKGFNIAAETRKMFVQTHLETGRRQLLGLVKDAMAAGKIKKGPPESVASVLFDGTMAFHHPKLVAQFLDVKREPILKKVLETLLRGLK